MTAPSGTQAALIAAIRAAADASSQQGTRISLGTPGSVEEIPESDDQFTGIGWGDGTESTFDVLTQGIVDFLYDAFVPIGSIRFVNGVGAIPTGWQIADGTGGTPNLIGQFIKGATTAGGTGGSTSTGTPSATTEVQSGLGVTVASSGHIHTHEPPFTEMIPIIRVS